MSTNEGHGREARSVYVRRRLWVLAGIVAVIAIIALVIWKPGSTSGAEPEPTQTEKSAATSSPTPTATQGVPGECTDDVVTVEALTDSSTYAAGALPQLSLRLSNTGEETCTINVGTAAQVFTITSGSDTYWTSTDCQIEPADAIVDLAAGQSVESTSPIAWDRTRSSPSTCEGERPGVPASGASYHLKTSVDGIESTSSKQFILGG